MAITSESLILECCTLSSYFQATMNTRSSLASSPGRPLEEGRPGIDCLRMRGVFRILSSKFDRKLNYARRACTL